MTYTEQTVIQSNATAEDAAEAMGRSTLVSRNITVVGRRTSVRLEPEMWSALREIAKREGCKIHDICSLIHLRKNPDTSLTAAIRVFLMLYYRAAATDDGHRRAGHGSFEHMLQRARMPYEVIGWRRPRRRMDHAPVQMSHMVTDAASMVRQPS